ncbi:hypothetical protein Q0590_08450 [Rhodocytophaga aerolata]|uniref:Tail tape measure protein n=1 Tax=Rhodocytophaga aerolata TaxID=455078 RepID=A0ABT8R2E8_9BACT|nr:hypothetical protein [Rhodocytophaga aerolata]MDO1446279.1 hypothetical protein [Rhodocytophaga aerolata]
METTGKKILFDLAIDKGGLLKNLEEVKAKLKEAQKEFEKSDAGSEAFQQAANRVSRLKDEVARLTTVQKLNQGSLAANKEELKKLRKEYDNLANPTKEQIKRIKDLSDTIKDQEEAIGVFSRSVGDYRGAISDAIKENTNFGKTIDGVGTAFKTNPIGLFLTSLISLVTLLQENTQFMEFFTRTFGILSTITKAISNEIVKFGENFVKALSDPKQLLIDFGNLIKENIENRFKAFGVIVKAIGDRDLKALANGLLQASTGVSDITGKFSRGASAASDFAKGIYSQADALNKLNLERKQLEREEILSLSRTKQMLAEEERLKNIRDDEYNTIEKRIAANTAARKLEQDRLKIESDLFQRKFDNLDKEIKLLGEANISNEKLREREEARLELADLLEDSLGRQNEYITENFNLNREAEEKNKAFLQAKLEDRKATIETELLAVAAGSEKELELREQLLKAERDLTLLNEGTTQEKRVLIEQTTIKEIEKLRKEFLENRKKEALELLELSRQQAQEALDFAKAAADADKEIRTRTTNETSDKKTLELTTKLLGGGIENEEFQAEQDKIELERLERQLALAQEYGEYTVDIEQQIADKRVEIKQNQADRETAIEQAKLQTLSAITDSAGSLIELLTGKSAEATDFGKGIAVAQIATNTAIAISELIKASEGNPLNLLTGGAAGVLQFTAGLARILANVAQAKKLLSEPTPEPPKFEYGGGFLVGGKDHSAGGTTFYSPDSGQTFEAQAGETIAIVKRNDTRRLSMLSAENVRRGGRPFFEYGGVEVVKGLSTPVQQRIDSNKDISQHVQTGVKAQPIYVRVSDIEKVQEGVKYAKGSAELK